MRQTAIAISATVAIAAAAVLVVFLWLRTYAPLQAVRPYAPGGGLGADIEPTFGSGGKTVYIPVYQGPRTFATTVTLHNAGRFAVTLTGIERGSGSLRAQTDVRHLRLDPSDSASVTVAWTLDCSNRHDEVSADTVNLRFRYLSLFRKTETVELPFAVTLRCLGGSRAAP